MAGGFGHDGRPGAPFAMDGDEGATLLRPPPKDPNKAPIEHTIEVTPMGVLGPDIFTNTRTPWHPPGARGVYGGAVIAQCLAAAQHTVGPTFAIHSCHCYFLLAGMSDTPILYHVERVRDGRSYATRTVQARQRGRCIFTTTVSFCVGESAAPQLRHAVALPAGVRAPSDSYTPDAGFRSGPYETTGSEVVGAGGIAVNAGGFANATGSEGVRNLVGEADSEVLGGSDGKVVNATGREGVGEAGREGVNAAGREGVDAKASGMAGAAATDRKCRQWMRAKGTISTRAAHQTALAYMSDSYFIGTVTRIHGVWRWPFAPREVAQLDDGTRRLVERINRDEGLGDGVDAWETRPVLGMMVSLDHSIYFHEPWRVKADEWMLADMDSPWAGDGRGVVMQRIFAKDGTLLATCVQEGVVRLKAERSKTSKL